jgi:hypothetical protein
MTNGIISLNGLTDKQMAKLFEFKASHEGAFNYNVNATQLVQAGPSTSVYNNVNLGWNGDQNLKVIMELVSILMTS